MFVASEPVQRAERPGGCDVVRLLCDVTNRQADILENARDADRHGAFPNADITALRACGALLAPLPRRHGGLGFGTEAHGADGLFQMLRMIGSASMAVGRVIEGHVNAVQLICTYGTEAQIARAAKDVAHGHLFAVWNTEAPPGVRLGRHGQLEGHKIHCSAATAATRPLITVRCSGGSRMLVASLVAGERERAMDGRLHGMRATRPGAVDFTGYVPDPDAWIGGAGDYLREPAFTGGAWRTLAVIAGGIEALVAALRSQLRQRGRDADPHQAARIAQGLIAQETALLWVRKAASVAEDGDRVPEDIAGYVNLARRAVEAAGLEVIQLVERSLGLAAFVDINPVERLLRDLATYLRQPAMDEGLTEAAARFVARPLPDDPFRQQC
jgi:alkylation response protein AidB-like acyl-CoA dehydrogenase